MKKIVGNPCGLNRLERSIAPPMRLAITIPINDSGIVVYVSASQFGPPASSEDVQQVAKTIVKALDFYENRGSEPS